MAASPLKEAIMNFHRFAKVGLAFPLLLATLAVHGPAAAAGKASGDLIGRADLNGDGRVTREEFISARSQLFTRLDRNRDGYISRDDASQSRIGRRAQGKRLGEALREFDRNNDGRIGRDEFVDRPTSMFDRFDTNRDRVLDSGEMMAMRGAIEARRRR